MTYPVGLRRGAVDPVEELLGEVGQRLEALRAEVDAVGVEAIRAARHVGVPPWMQARRVVNQAVVEQLPEAEAQVDPEAQFRELNAIYRLADEVSRYAEDGDLAQVEALIQEIGARQDRSDFSMDLSIALKTSIKKGHVEVYQHILNQPWVQTLLREGKISLLLIMADTALLDKGEVMTFFLELMSRWNLEVHPLADRYDPSSNVGYALNVAAAEGKLVALEVILSHALCQSLLLEGETGIKSALAAGA